MFTLLISLSTATIFYIFIYILSHNYPLSIIVAFLSFFAVNFFLGRKILKKVSALFKLVERDINAQKFEQAIKKLEAGLSLAKWQFLIKKQIYAQIGIIYYLKKDNEQAKNYLQKGTLRNWVAATMLATIYFKNKDYDKMKKILEKAIKYSKKEGFLYSLYAYYLTQLNEKNKAIEILNQGTKKAVLDEKLQANLEALRNGKKIKMQNYGSLWMQLNISKIPQGIKPYHLILANKHFKPR
jgi:tetratricopeptide (TPR) repeat protein